MSKAVGEFVKKDDKDAIDNMVDHQVKSANSSLNQVSLVSLHLTSLVLDSTPLFPLCI